MAQWVYNFGGGKADGAVDARALLGGKGANLAEMSRLGLPVPPGFTITTDVCRYFYDHSKTYPDGLKQEVEKALKQVGQLTGRTFGDTRSPLLVSVRSGASVSMPGMMDTVLNLGLNDETVKALAATTDERFAYDSYRRFIQIYAHVVMGLDIEFFEEILDEAKARYGHDDETAFDGKEWREIIQYYKTLIEKELEEAFPQNVEEQLWKAIAAVFSSWMTPRAKTYRSLHDISDHYGTAVNIQAMVFGNMGKDSATGVAFTRHPSTGENTIFGEYLLNAQGEDVVSGVRTPCLLTEAQRCAAMSDVPSLETLMPETFADFVHVCGLLERHYRDMQDIEFTIERGQLWMLQTRSGKRSVEAALKIAVDMADEGLMSQQEALLMVDAGTLDQLLHPTISPDAECILLTNGLPASPGAASGVIVFSPEEAEKRVKDGQKVILVRNETSPDDIRGVHVAEGVLTARGGMTSHAAVVARSMGKPCICGAAALKIDYKTSQMTIQGKNFHQGDDITIDGSSGAVFQGHVKTVKPHLSASFERLMQWADQVRNVEIRANADHLDDVETALMFGAEGIGLCRTERMFLDSQRIFAMQQMILAKNSADRQAALAKLLPVQRDDLAQIFERMQERSVTVRLLDTPLHEFLPRDENGLQELANAMDLSIDELKKQVEDLSEYNPTIGLRGCRLAIVYPDIVEMQARAIFEAAIKAEQACGKAIRPEIMVPFVAVRAEFDFVKQRIEAVAQEINKHSGKRVDYSLGIMIELPHAALNADELAQTCDFFSFGTNDLTQTTFGISRDDSSSFLSHYLDRGLLSHDPFTSLDRSAVGRLMAISIKEGRKANKKLKTIICGEHGGDPSSIAFFVDLEMDIISCSPFRVPIARLAAAQSALKAALKSAAPI